MVDPVLKPHRPTSPRQTTTTEDGGWRGGVGTWRLVWPHTHTTWLRTCAYWRSGRDTCGSVGEVMTYTVMAYTVMAYILMAYLVMALYSCGMATISVARWWGLISRKCVKQAAVVYISAQHAVCMVCVACVDMYGVLYMPVQHVWGVGGVQHARHVW